MSCSRPATSEPWTSPAWVIAAGAAPRAQPIGWAVVRGAASIPFQRAVKRGSRGASPAGAAAGPPPKACATRSNQDPP